MAAMRVLVAGGTGALGRSLLPLLARSGHEVTTLSRRPAASDEPGLATHLSVDVLNAHELRMAVAEAAPEVVVHALTALPSGGPRRRSDLRATNALRTQGTDNLVAACLASNVRRIVAESFMLVYGSGDFGSEPLREEHALGPVGPLADAVEPLRYLERAVLAAGTEAVVLRYGAFYGRGSGTSEGQARLLRRRLLPLPGGAPALISWVHILDAASATAQAVEIPSPGQVYNVADDEPARLADFLGETARAIGAPRPRSIPLWAVKPFAPFAAAFAHDLRLPLANAKLRASGWVPRYPTYRDGLAALARESPS